MHGSGKPFHWTPIVLVVCLAASLVFSVRQPAVAASLAQEEICQMPFVPVSLPLTELGNQEYVRMDGQATGFVGGLYPDGSNQPPPEHLQAGLELAGQITPLDGLGNPDPANGRIILLSIGMSNTAIEFGAFDELAKTDPQVNPQVLRVNGALSSQTSDRWLDPKAVAWTMLAENLERYQFSPLQVQAAWVKLTQVQGGDFPAKAQALQADLEVIVQHLKTKFPNLKIVYLSSRTRSYTTWRGLSPEPVAFETGFAVKWLIEAQINGAESLNYDPARGEVRAPYLTWGPYLWIDGQNPRADGQVWLAEDMTGDCTHPTASGADKVAAMLLDFFRSDATARPWFLGRPAALAPTSSPTNTTSPTLPAATETLLLLATASATSPPPVLTATPTEDAIGVSPTEIFPLPAGQSSIIWPVLTGGGLAILILSALLLARRKPRM